MVSRCHREGGGSPFRACVDCARTQSPLSSVVPECWARLVVGDCGGQLVQLVLEDKTLRTADPSVIEVRTNSIRRVFEERELRSVDDRVPASGVAGVPVRGLYSATSTSRPERTVKGEPRIKAQGRSAESLAGFSVPPYLPVESSGLTYGLDGGNVGSDRAELTDHARCRLAIQRFASLVARIQVRETVNGGLHELLPYLVVVSRHVVVEGVVALRHEMGGVLELPVQGDLHPGVFPGRDGKRPAEAVRPDGRTVRDVLEQTEVRGNIHRFDEAVNLLPGVDDWIGAMSGAYYDPVVMPAERLGEACCVRHRLDHHPACLSATEGLELLAGQGEMAPERFDAAAFQ